MTAWLRREAAEEGRLIRRAWSLFRRDTGALIGGTIIAGILAEIVVSVLAVVLMMSVVGGSTKPYARTATVELIAFAVFVVAVPFVGGLIGLVVSRVRHGTKGKVGDIFDGFGQFLDLALAAVVMVGPSMALSALVGHASLSLTVLTGVLNVALALPFAYLLPAIVDGRRGFRQALPISLRLLRRGGLARTIVALVSLVPLSVAVDLPAYLGGSGAGWTFLTLVIEVVAGPFVLVYVVCMYFRARDEQDALDEAIARPDPPRVTVPTLQASGKGSRPLKIPKQL